MDSYCYQFPSEWSSLTGCQCLNSGKNSCRISSLDCTQRFPALYSMVDGEPQGDSTTTIKMPIDSVPLNDESLAALGSEYLSSSGTTGNYYEFPTTSTEQRCLSPASTYSTLSSTSFETDTDSGGYDPSMQLNNGQVRNGDKLTLEAQLSAERLSNYFKSYQPPEWPVPERCASPSTTYYSFSRPSTPSTTSTNNDTSEAAVDLPNIYTPAPVRQTTPTNSLLASSISQWLSDDVGMYESPEWPVPERCVSPSTTYYSFTSSRSSTPSTTSTDIDMSEAAEVLPALYTPAPIRQTTLTNSLVQWLSDDVGRYEPPEWPAPTEHLCPSPTLTCSGSTLSSASLETDTDFGGYESWMQGLQNAEVHNVDKLTLANQLSADRLSDYFKNYQPLEWPVPERCVSPSTTYYSFSRSSTPSIDFDMRDTVEDWPAISIPNPTPQTNSTNPVEHKKVVSSRKNNIAKAPHATGSSAGKRSVIDKRIPSAMKSTTKERLRVRCRKGCGKTFGHKRDMERHVQTSRIHADANDERPFACRFHGCSSTFMRQDVLRRHQRAKHPS